MPLDPFPFLKNNTRLVKHKNTLYKVKVVYDLPSNTPNGCKCDRGTAHQEIEDVFRAVLYLSERGDNLKPILTDHFIISANKITWALPEKYGFSQNGKILQACRYLFHLKVKLRDDVKDGSRVEVAPESSAKLKRSEATSSEASKQNANKSAVLVEKVVSGSDSIPRFSRTEDGRLLRTVPDEASTNNSSTSDIIYVRPKSADKQDHVKRKLNNTESPRSGNIKSYARTRSSHYSPKNLKTRINTSSNQKTGKVSVGSPAVSSKYKLRNRKLKPAHSHSASPYSLRTKRKPVSYREDESDHGHKPSPRRKSTKRSEGGLLKESNTHIIKHKRRYTKSPQNFSSSSERSLRSWPKRKREAEFEKERQTEVRKRLRSYSSAKSDSETDDSTEVKRAKPKHREQHEQSVNSETRRKSKRHLEVKELAQQNSGVEPDRPDSHNVSGPREGLRPRHTLYTDKASPQVIQKPLAAAGRLTSPRVSTVLPVKRKSDLQSAVHVPEMRPRQLRSAHNQRDMTPVGPHAGQQGHQAVNAESRRLQRMVRMVGERPTQMYRDILLGQTRDRHMVEQAERAETEKLRQLYKPVRRSPRNLGTTALNRRSSGLWGRFMDGVVTPVKMFMSRK